MSLYFGTEWYTVVGLLRHPTITRGGVVIRTQDGPQKPSIPLGLHTMFGSDYCVPLPTATPSKSSHTNSK